jgi:ferritin
MIKQRVADALNKQINAELYSAYLYLSMASYFEGENLSGFSNWMRIQFEEEQFHGMKLFNYLHERGGKVTLEAIEKPKSEWDSITAVFEETLEHERHVTSLINNLMDIALEESDHATASFLRWYIDEQVEEEAGVESILTQLKFIGGQGNALLMMDREFAARQFTPPANA